MRYHAPMLPRWLLAAALLAVAPAAPCRAEVVDPAPFDTVLANYAHGDWVDYANLAADPGPLQRYLATCERAAPDRFSRPEQFAFWVNAYNARVLDGVLRRPGIESVLVPGKMAWIRSKTFFRERRLTAGREWSLDDIEHRILRAGFRDPRVHFVLNCASVSCPALPPRALTAAALDSTLDAAARAFLADTTKNRLAADGWLELSAIFQWFAEDFQRAGQTLPVYLAKYWPGPLPKRPPVRFLNYNWALNGSW